MLIVSTQTSVLTDHMAVDNFSLQFRTYYFVLQEGHLYLWAVLLQTSQLFDFLSTSFLIIAKPEWPFFSPDHVCTTTMVALGLTTKAWVLICTNSPPGSPQQPFSRKFCKMAASFEKDKSDEKRVKGFLAQLVARYNYCVLTHPVLTKSVTRQVQLVFATVNISNAYHCICFFISVARWCTVVGI